jgi:ubiquinone/menaquinone biosynthesis C-methylase UbiE
MNNIVSDWQSSEYVLAYLSQADKIPHRTEGESTLLEELPVTAKRILDIGSGNGRLLDLCLMQCPDAMGVALDFSPAMLNSLKVKYKDGERVKVIEHDINNSLPFDSDSFDVVVSSFAIHHVNNGRKKELYKEVWKLLEREGTFCNLEHVASPTENLHKKFFEKLGTEEDNSNILLDVETQIKWLNEIGFQEVDCYWKWRELALLVGKKFNW